MSHKESKRAWSILTSIKPIFKKSQLLKIARQLRQIYIWSIFKCGNNNNDDDDDNNNNNSTII
jgi:hypothetical protein